MKPQEISNLIKEVKWKPEQKQEFLDLIIHFGQNTQEYFLDQALAPVSWLVAEHINNGLKILSDTIVSINSGNLSPLQDLIAGADANQQLDFGEMLVPFVIDLLKMLQLGKLNVDEKTLELIYSLVCENLDKIKPVEFKEFLSGPIKYALVASDLFPKVQTYVVKNFIQGSNEIKEITAALQKNQNFFGKLQLTLPEKTGVSTIENWLLDFNGFSGKGISDRTTFEIVSYLQTSANTQKLSQKEQALLAELLKIYVWLSQASGSQRQIGASAFVKSQNFTLPNGQPESQKVAGTEKEPLQPEARQVSVSDIMQASGPGLKVFNDKENVKEKIDLNKIILDVNEKKKQAQAHIDEKLEDLKKRSS